jgi:pentapeptide repeat protein
VNSYAAAELTPLPKMLASAVGLDASEVGMAWLDHLHRTTTGEPVELGRCLSPRELSGPHIPDGRGRIGSVAALAERRGETWTCRAIVDVWQTIRHTGAPGVDLRGIYAVGASLSGADLRGTCMAGADLTRADLSEAKLADASLENAVLAGADLRMALCRGANFGCADLRRVDFTAADLRDSNFEKAALRGAEMWAALTSGARFEDAYAHGCELERRDQREIS